jgi:gas vesicle protein
MSQHDYDEDNATVGFIAGMIVGGLFGAGLALLMAPRSGRQTRRKIRRAAEDIGDRAEQGIERAAADVRRVAGEARRAAERSGKQVRRSVERGRERLNL